MTLNFAASSTLAEQIRQGARADVVAFADEDTMARLTDASLVEAPAVFARNRLAIVVARSNPKAVRALTDLARPGLVVVLCAQQVPCGRFAGESLRRAGVQVAGASREENVKAVLTKVRLGEADAGIVYVTDVRSGGPSVEAIRIPDGENVVGSYPVAVVRSAQNRAGARAFAAAVTSPDGSAILRRFGFESP